MRVMVKKWGNSAAIRIPSSIMQAARLGLDEAVEMHEQGGQILIKPVRSNRKVVLAVLLAGITSENLHGEADFGGPRGKELL